MEKTIKGKVTGSADVLDEMLGYSYASLEYAGLVMLSYVKRGGMTVLDPLEKIALPAWSKVRSMYGLAATVRWFRERKMANMAERLDAIDKRLLDIEDSIATKEALDRIEKRLAYLEKHGIMATKEGGLQVKGKKLTEDKLMLLKTIVRENIDIMEGE
ncbi:MAG: hypothetical protein HQL08_09985 [Nitrospirae bacterium]|nr:hypothetical protein [Nitrospirota bacterium]